MTDTSCEVIDLQTLVPWDKQAVVDSVAGPDAWWSSRRVRGQPAGAMTSPPTCPPSCSARCGLPVLRITCPDAPVPHSADSNDASCPRPSTSPSRPVS